ncbi:SDR family oxidoreductase, partial [Streptomyces niveus]
LVDFYPGLTAYLTHRRRFDDTRVRALFGSSVASERVDLDYLRSGLVPGGPVPGGPLATGVIPSAAGRHV